MDFQHLASVEARALVDRLLQEHAAASLRHLQILRDALDEAAREISAPGDPAPLLEALTDRLTTAAAADVESARQEAAAPVQALEAGLERERERAEQLASALVGAETEISRLATEADTVRAAAAAAEQQAGETALQIEEHLLRIEQLTAALSDAEERRAALTADIQAERARADAAEHAAHEQASQTAARLEAGREEIERLTSALREAEGRAAAAASELDAARARVEALDQDLAVTIDAHAEVERTLHETEAELRQAVQARAAIEAELAQARSTVARGDGEAAELRDQIERQAATIAALEERLAAALDAGVDRDALSRELESCRARIATLEDGVRERDAHTRDVETRLLEASQAEAQLLEDLAARELALEGEQAAARGIREQLDVLAADHESATTLIRSLEADLAAARDAGRDREALAADLRDSTGRSEALRTELEAAVTAAAAEREALRADLTTRAARIDALESDLATAARSAHEERAGLTERLESALARVQALEEDHAAEAAARADVQARLDTAQAQLDAANAREASRVEADANRHEREADADALRLDVERMTALFDASARALTEMAQVTSSADLLTDLIKRLSLQFSRVALFRVKGDRLAGEQQIGFDPLDITTLALPSSGGSLAARALGSRTTARATGPEACDTGLPPGGPSTAALALPILLNGVPIAVVYADDAGMPEAAGHETSVAFAELLVGHVVALLVRHTHELKTLAELREYAATLLEEARSMYQSDAAAGKSGEELRSRLRESLDCASQLYAYRAAMEGTVAASLFDEQIAEAGAGDTPFAHDLRGLLETCESLILNP